MNFKNIFLRKNLLIILSLIYIVILSFLMFDRLDEAEVRINLYVEELSFNLVSNLNIYALEINKVKVLKLDTLTIKAKQIEPLSPGFIDKKYSSNFRLIPVDLDNRIIMWGKGLRISTLKIKRGSFVKINTTDLSKNSFRIFISKEPANLYLNTYSTFNIICNRFIINNNKINEAQFRITPLPLYRQFQIRSFENELELIVDLDEKIVGLKNYMLIEKNNIPITSLDIKYENISSKERKGPSNIKEGSIEFVRMENNNFSLKIEEDLRVGKLKEFYINNIEIKDGFIHALFRGKVGYIRKGDHPPFENLMPFQSTRLTSWYKSSSLNKFIAAFSFFVLLILNIKLLLKK